MWGALIPVIGGLLEKLIPDPQAAAEAKLKAIELAQKGELAALDAEIRLALGQLEVNKAEAATDGYKAGWRPTIGYVCAAALAWTYILNPVITWAVAIWAPGTAVPNIAIDDHLWELMLGMLGLAGWRTMDKGKGRS